MAKEYEVFLNTREERNTIGLENEETDRTMTAGQADITNMLCNLFGLVIRVSEKW